MSQSIDSKRIKVSLDVYHQGNNQDPTAQLEAGLGTEEQLQLAIHHGLVSAVDQVRYLLPAQHLDPRNPKAVFYRSPSFKSLLNGASRRSVNHAGEPCTASGAHLMTIDLCEDGSMIATLDQLLFCEGLRSGRQALWGACAVAVRMGFLVVNGRPDHFSREVAEFLSMFQVTQISQRVDVASTLFDRPFSDITQAYLSPKNLEYFRWDRHGFEARKETFEDILMTISCASLTTRRARGELRSDAEVARFLSSARIHHDLDPSHVPQVYRFSAVTNTIVGTIPVDEPLQGRYFSQLLTDPFFPLLHQHFWHLTESEKTRLQGARNGKQPRRFRKDGMGGWGDRIVERVRSSSIAVIMDQRSRQARPAA